MANRILRDGWKDSDSIVDLSWREQVFFIRLLSTVDDFGRYDGRTSMLRVACYPLELHKMSEQDLESCLCACEAAGLIKLYSVQGKRYVEVQKFNQRMRAKESKYPDPSENDSHMTGICQSHDSHMSDTCPLKAESESETETKTNKTTHTPRGSAGSVQALPRSVEEVLNHMLSMPHCGLSGAAAEECARKFFDSGEECGWLTKNGLPVNNWHASLRKWVQSWQQHDTNRPTPTGSKPNYTLDITQ